MSDNDIRAAIHEAANALQAAVVLATHLRRTIGRQVDDAVKLEAAVDGAYTLAAALNAIKAPSPRAQLGRLSAWSVSSIREVLKRPLYRGEIVWGKTTSAYGRELGKLTKMRGGIEREKAQIPTREETWIRLPVDESLRIVDANVAAAVDASCSSRPPSGSMIGVGRLRQRECSPRRAVPDVWIFEGLQYRRVWKFRPGKDGR